MVILQNESQIIEARRAFGILFVTVAMAVAIGTILTEIAFLNNTSLYYYAIIWLGSFSITFGAVFSKIRKSIRSIQGRMKNSMKWPTNAKAINGICWACPFAIIPLFPHFYQFLVLLGIGAGNFSTYLFMKIYNSANYREQMMVGLISLAAIPIALGIDMTFFISRQDVAIMISRISVSIAYGVAGIYALFR
ncbi:MAG TPA: hypothetical protein VE223_03220 [Nitrososphaeraceae archaeon]|nr:hypothetical protein [Nitrososphaeraceae archaeon]